MTGTATSSEARTASSPRSPRPERRRKWQIRAAILLEGVIVAVFGGLIGVVTGVVTGSIAAASLPSDIISIPSVPGGTVVVYLIVSAVAGLLASLAPARRANRIDLLEAISYH